ncbi:hypothetical protein [Streptococcus suis]|uniref:hypothetical protein n=1 Tax=Streptococcus suis TaxID=1307 RepID=UPI000C1930E9|nr:hypothetical protein [Streptococcus suis]
MNKEQELRLALLRNDNTFLEELDMLLEVEELSDADIARNLRIKHREYKQKAFDLKQHSGLSYLEIIKAGL